MKKLKKDQVMIRYLDEGYKKDESINVHSTRLKKYGTHTFK